MLEFRAQDRPLGSSSRAQASKPFRKWQEAAVVIQDGDNFRVLVRTGSK